MTAPAPRLAMTGVRKRFGATVALSDVSLRVEPGEVHALIGENGAGKSTLMKILSGAERPDTGRMELDGRPFTPTDPLHARRGGISMIYQELNLAPHLSVEENLLLGAEPHHWGWLERSRRRALARDALAELRHPNIPLDAAVGGRPIAEQQVVEIARALVGRPRVLIMDEPTSSLAQFDTENLFRVIDRLKTREVSVIYISHFLEECQRVADRYTVLRDGHTAGTGPMSEASLDLIIRLMVGRDIREVYPRRPRSLGDPILELRDVAGLAKPRQVSATLRAGEILGIAGLVGAGRTETARAVFGLDRLASGEVRICGQPTGRAGPAERLASGLGLLSENRKEEGLMLNRSLADNLTLSRFRSVSTLGWIRPRRQRAAARHWMQRLAIRARGPGQMCGHLSGGNQQKVALARLLHHDARILLLDEPTRGIDVASKVQIYQLMDEWAANGKALMFISSYLPELLGICDTIAVMCRGVLSETRPAEAWDETEIIRVAVGRGSESMGTAP